MESFKDIGIKSDFIKGLKDLGIIHPTDIQKKVIPLLLKGNNSTILLTVIVKFFQLKIIISKKKIEIVLNQIH